MTAFARLCLRRRCIVLLSIEPLVVLAVCRDMCESVAASECNCECMDKAGRHGHVPERLHESLLEVQGG